MIVNKNSKNTDLLEILSDLEANPQVNLKYFPIMFRLLNAEETTHATFVELANRSNGDTYWTSAAEHFQKLGYLDLVYCGYGKSKILHMIPSHYPTTEKQRAAFRENIDFVALEIAEGVRNIDGDINWKNHHMFDQDIKNQGGVPTKKRGGLSTKTKKNTKTKKPVKKQIHIVKIPPPLKTGVKKKEINKINNYTNKQTSASTEKLKINGCDRIQPRQETIKAQQLKHKLSDDDMSILLDAFLNLNEINQTEFKNLGAYGIAFMNFVIAHPKYLARKESQIDKNLDQKSAQVIDIQRAKEKRATKKPASKITSKPKVDQKIVKNPPTMPMNHDYYAPLEELYVKKLGMPKAKFTRTLTRILNHNRYNPPGYQQSWLNWAEKPISDDWEAFQKTPEYSELKRPMLSDWSLDDEKHELLTQYFESTYDLDNWIDEFKKQKSNIKSNDWDTFCYDWIVKQLDNQLNAA